MPKKSLEICDKALELLRDDAKERERRIKSLLSLCESHAEQILLAAISRRFKPNVHVDGRSCSWELRELPDWEGIFDAVLEPQKEILYSDGYRADFHISVVRRAHHANEEAALRPRPNLIVEVDGNDFPDRKRDRDPTQEGYLVIRFTGSDVLNNPDQCASDIKFQLDKIAGEVFRHHLGKLEKLLPGGPQRRLRKTEKSDDDKD